MPGNFKTRGNIFYSAFYDAQYSTVSTIKTLLLICVTFFSLFFATYQNLHADPTRQEVYRNEQLKIFVYKDNTDPNIFWYLPPLRLLEQDGKLVYYKRPKLEHTDYYFYIVPYMNDTILDLMASEVPSVQSRSQLRPVIAKKFGIRIAQFDVTSLGNDVTDYQYINTPQLLKLSLDPTKSEDFEFFLENIPGIRSDVLFYYTAERVDKYITVTLSCKDVYEAMRIGASGKYEFIRAEIEDKIFDYISNRNLNVKGRGDLPLPDIVNRALIECFAPVNLPRTPLLSRILDKIGASQGTPIDRAELQKTLIQRQALLNTLIVDTSYNPFESRLNPRDLPQPGAPLGGGPGDRPIGTNPPIGTTPPIGSTPGAGTRPGDPRYPGNPGNPNLPIQDGVQFYFKRETANIDRSFFYHREQVGDSSEITSIPVMLNAAPASAPQIVARPYPRKEFVINFDKSETAPFNTGIMITEGDQFLINAAFSLFAESSYDHGKNRQFRWVSTWADPNVDLYYRVGTGPWTAVGGRKVISSDTLARGEVQFYVDRRKLWEKIPEDYKKSEYLGLVPAIFTYPKTYPQYNVVITGRNVTLGRPSSVEAQPLGGVESYF